MSTNLKTKLIVGYGTSSRRERSMSTNLKTKLIVGYGTSSRRERSMSTNLKTKLIVVANWTRRPREVSSSTTREGFVDLPLDAATWLVHFKSQNSALLNKLDAYISAIQYVFVQHEQ
uniref:Uncharacterized protein n=1 Tax=Timema tahoe TaxID=61484 RepID=A0A7R9IJV5_9NEOP|nr:unnamed protein product [Timema tahoe]